MISKPASKGMENRKSVVLQSHVDMVCEANKDTVIDFDNDQLLLILMESGLKQKVQLLELTTVSVWRLLWQFLQTIVWCMVQ